MSLQLIFWSALAVITLVIVPAVMIGSMLEQFRGRGSDRKGSGTFSAGVGAAMQELDRILTRPSIEHQIETEERINRREDDAGGD